MRLPGGIVVKGQVKRDFRFKAVTGELELSIGECKDIEKNTPNQVTYVLQQALDEIGGLPATRKRVAELCVGDRQYLMAQLGALIDDDPIWLTVQCANCEELFDITFQLSELPVKPAGAHFPRWQLQTSVGKAWVRVPNGIDQEVVANSIEEVDSLKELLKQIICPVDTGQELHVDQLTQEDLELIESTVETMSPEMTLNATGACPHCEHINQVPINPYLCIERSANDLLSQIHILAATYGWSEKQILGLPRQRRHTYLKLIDKSRGMYESNQLLHNESQ